jgi:TolB-like protein/Tfp pilus assembly protein PilF
MALLLVLKEERKESPPIVTPPASSTQAETEQLRRQIVPDRWQQEDFQAMAPRLDRLIRDDPDNADAWALRSLIESLQVTRNFDAGTKPLEAGKNDADRALRLAPQSPLANLAMGMHLVAMISRGGDAQACRPWLDRAVAVLPASPLTRYCGGVSRWLSYDFAESERAMHAWIEAEPHAGFPNWILAQLNMVARRPDQAEQFAIEAAREDGITGIRARYTLFESSYYLRADLARSREILQGIPPGGSTVHRVVHARWLVAMAEHHWDDALQGLARLPENFLFDRAFHGPKALLAGMAHARAGRADAANAQFREAERLLREHLSVDPDNEELHAVLAVALACLGHADAARSELALVEPLVRGRVANVYRGSLVIQIAQARCLLGDYNAMAIWMRKLFAEKSAFPFTPASFALDPRFSGGLDAPEIRALLQEFAALGQPAVKAVGAGTDDKSVAVLAFANLSDDKANEYFSDGISEELLNVLAKVPGLKVTARTSSFHFKGKDTSVPEIARQLGVAYVVEGSVRKQGDKVRITAQLIKAVDGFHVWSDTFTRDLKDIFAVQDEIAGLIANNLSLKLGVKSVAATASVNPEAFELYVQGRQAWTLRTEEGFNRAEQLLHRALALAPNFARAHAALADVALLRAIIASAIGRFDQRNSPEQARLVAQIQGVLALDPDLAEAHASLGFALEYGWDFDGAERELRRAIALNPNYAPAHQWLGTLLIGLARVDEGLAEAKLATELDPLSSRILDNYGGALRLVGRHHAALAVMDRALALQPDSAQALRSKVEILAALGRFAEAVPLARQLPGGSELNDETRVAVFAHAGLKAEAAALFAQLNPDVSDRRSLLLALGRPEEALASFGNPASTLVPEAMFLSFDPLYDTIRAAPRFQKCMAALGRTEIHARAQAWRQAHPAEKPEPKP